MSIYKYEVVNRSGQTKKGTIEAKSKDEAMSKLKANGFYPTSIKKDKSSKEEVDEDKDLMDEAEEFMDDLMEGFEKFLDWACDNLITVLLIILFFTINIISDWKLRWYGIFRMQHSS